MVCAAVFIGWAAGALLDRSDRTGIVVVRLAFQAVCTFTRVALVNSRVGKYQDQSGPELIEQARRRFESALLMTRGRDTAVSTDRTACTRSDRSLNFPPRMV